jgi:molybdopterin-guanine dinucleotide biosynthesis protein A
MADAAVLLAGGHGRRAGGPKACKLVAARPWWRLQYEAMGDGTAAHVIAVLHPTAWQAPEPPQPHEAVVADPDAAMLASLHRGLAATQPGQRVWLLPVDCPWPGRDVAQALAAAGQDRSDWLAARPVCRDAATSPIAAERWRGGHPLLLSAQGVAAVLQLDPLRDRLDHWLAALSATARIDVAVTDRAVLANFNADGVSR